MTYFITALENTKAKLIVSETRTTDKAIAELVAQHLRYQGFLVILREEP